MQATQAKKCRCSTTSVRSGRPLSIRAALPPVKQSSSRCTTATVQPTQKPVLAAAGVAAACMLVLMPLQPAVAAPQEGSPAEQNSGGGFFKNLFSRFTSSTPLAAPPPAVKTGVSRGLVGAPSGTSAGQPASTTNAQPVKPLSELLQDVEGPTTKSIENPIKQLKKDAQKAESVLEQRVGDAKDSGKVAAPAPPGV